MTLSFCTYLDSGYLSRGLALYTSLVEHAGDFHLHVLCMDDRAAQVLNDLKLSRLSVVPLRDLEEAHPPLAAVSTIRSRIEYYFTTTPAWILFALEQTDGMMTYVDADMHLFADPAPAFDEMSDASVGIVAHRFAPELEDRLRFGKFNVGWLTFVNDRHAREVLRAWRAQCIDWCYDRLDRDRFADQKYLDVWPERYPFVRVLEHPGINVAPWNIGYASVEDHRGQPEVAGRPLVAYHFHGLRKIWGRVYDGGFDEYGVSPNHALRNLVYAPYVSRLEAWEVGLARNGYAIESRTIRGPTAPGSFFGTLRKRMSLLRRRVGGHVITASNPQVATEIESILDFRVPLDGR